MNSKIGYLRGVTERRGWF